MITINVLVICTHNSCRSQMLHAYLQRGLHIDTEPPFRANIYSAGRQCGGIDPLAIKAMALDEIDISDHTCNHINEYKNIEFDYVVTVCDDAAETCPVFLSNAKKLHRSFPQPEQGNLDDYIRVREMLASYAMDLTPIMVEKIPQ